MLTIHGENERKNAWSNNNHMLCLSLKPDEARHEVDLWAERKTRVLIKEVLPSLSVKWDTALILGNALYFKRNMESKA
jgi:serpin B